jgi:hypothetical protein
MRRNYDGKSDPLMLIAQVDLWLLCEAVMKPSVGATLQLCKSSCR